MCCNTGVTIELSCCTGGFRCVIELTEKSITLCEGTGNSAVEAQENAAQSALKYLNNNTKQ
jgi:dsRNA-specific ribonuclease